MGHLGKILLESGDLPCSGIGGGVGCSCGGGCCGGGGGGLLVKFVLEPDQYSKKKLSQVEYDLIHIVVTTISLV